MDFVRYPQTPHLAWLGPDAPRQDKVLSVEERGAFLRDEILVEEKVDGASVGLSVAPDGRLRAQNRGGYLDRGSHPQFDPLWSWLARRESELSRALGDQLVLFGEWCVAVHSLHYDRLPDWFLGFDVYDQGERRFWSPMRRDRLFKSLAIMPVPAIRRGCYGLQGLCDLLQQARSAVGSVPPEGLYLRRQSDQWLTDRAKLVRAEFVQAMGEHWSRRPVERNGLVADAEAAIPRESRQR